MAHLESAAEELEAALSVIPSYQKPVRKRVQERAASIRAILAAMDASDAARRRQPVDALGAAAQHLSLTGRPEAGR